MDREEIRRIIRATGEEITDEQGSVVGYVAQPARFKLNRPYLALGGFLVVMREEETGEYVGTEFDALPHPRTREPYPAGHSEQVWRTASLEEAFVRVMANFADEEVN
jgi:hypothetical protein